MLMNLHFDLKFYPQYPYSSAASSITPQLLVFCFDIALEQVSKHFSKMHSHYTACEVIIHRHDENLFWSCQLPSTF